MVFFSTHIASLLLCWDLYLSSSLNMGVMVEREIERWEMKGYTAVSHCFSSITFLEHVRWRENMHTSRYLSKVPCWSYTSSILLHSDSGTNMEVTDIWRKDLTHKKYVMSYTFYLLMSTFLFDAYTILTAVFPSFFPEMFIYLIFL